MSGAHAALYTSALTYSRLPASEITAPPKDWPTSTVGPSCASSIENQSGGGHIAVQGAGGVLDNGDGVAVGGQKVRP
ncbi:hypothetical protein GCM10011578_099360 [Streptomyces fuscichromogenes]|uniref:Uncharacterized protein n=1 Tax=Streptomyces fuscichromogenes TaxID=1324013 RepID=A0A917XPG1_9ACTN|nr:hypothetical protein GCM10011578_099360 [Streptomyces fuscichromogenes]